jgi:hypothetical protein
MDETSPQNRMPLRRPVMNYDAPPEEKKERIKTWMGTTIVLTALLVNGVVALLNFVVIGDVGLGSIILGVANLPFILWFWFLDVSFTKNPKNLAVMVIQALIGLIPILNTLPELTVGVLIIVLLTRAEDKGGMLGKAVSLAEGKMKS